MNRYPSANRECKVTPVLLERELTGGHVQHRAPRGHAAAADRPRSTSRIPSANDSGWETGTRRSSLVRSATQPGGSSPRRTRIAALADRVPDLLGQLADRQPLGAADVDDLAARPADRAPGVAARQSTCATSAAWIGLTREPRPALYGDRVAAPDSPTRFAISWSRCPLP